MANPHPFPATIPRYRVIATANLKSLTITDLIQAGWDNYYGGHAAIKILLRCSVDGSVFYSNAGFATSDFSTPDIDGSTNVWVSAAIDFPTDDHDHIQKGNYLFEALYTNGYNTALITQSKYYDYRSPRVKITMTASCSKSQLFESDVTDYNVKVGGNEFTPTTLTRANKIVPPSGSGANDPGTTTDQSRTIGGGNTDATRLWTRIWQNNISTILAYNIEKWNKTDTEPWWFVINDEVYGDDDINVRCDASLCKLIKCFNNLFKKWCESLGSDFGYKEEKRDTVIQAIGLLELIDGAERCGNDTDHLIRKLADVLKSESCKCEDDDDEQTHVIIQWGASIGGGNSPSTFVYSFIQSEPPSGGNNGDVAENNSGLSGDGNIWQNVGGTWVLKGNVKGAKGDPGADAQNASSANILYTTLTDVGTPAGTGETVLGTYDIPGGALITVGDYNELEAIYDLGLNDNGKTLKLYYGGDLVASFFTDALIAAGNKSVVLRAKIRKVTTNSQKIDAYIESEDGTISEPITLTAAKDLSSSITVNASAQNSVANANDVVLKSFTVYLNSVVTVLPTAISNWNEGYTTLVADTPLPITFAKTMPSTNYIFSTSNAWDVDGNVVLVQIPPASKTVNGFTAVANTNATYHWKVEQA